MSSALFSQARGSQFWAGLWAACEIGRQEGVQGAADNLALWPQQLSVSGSRARELSQFPSTLDPLGTSPGPSVDESLQMCPCCSARLEGCPTPRAVEVLGGEGTYRPEQVRCIHTGNP